MTTKIKAMKLYNDERRADAENQIKSGQKDKHGMPIQPWVDKSYEELAIILVDQYLIQYVNAEKQKQVVLEETLI